MRRLLRFAARAALVVLVLAAAALAAAYGFSQTERFRELVRGEIVARAGGAIAGELSLGAVEGSVWSEIVLRDLELRDGAETVARIPVVRVRYALAALALGWLRLEAFELERPELVLRQDEEGEWNLLRAASPPEAPDAPPAAEGEGGLPLSIALESLRVESLGAEIHAAGSEPVRVRDFDLAAEAEIAATGGVTARIAKLRGRLELPGRPELRVAGRASYDGASTPAVIRLGSLTLATARSTVELSGTVRGVEAPVTDLRLAARPLAAADVNELAPGVGLRPDVTGEITAKGGLDDLRLEASIAAGEARLRSTASLDATREEPPWSARLAATGLDLGKLLSRADAAGRLEARLDARGRGAAPGAVAGEASIEADGVAFADWRPGDLTLDLRVAERRAHLEAALEPGRGRATLAGEIDLSGEETFDLRLVAEHLAPMRSADGEPSGDVNAEVAARGRGFSPASLDAAIEATVHRSVLAGASLDAARLEATVADGRASGNAEASGFRSGETRFAAARSTFTARGIASDAPAADVDLVVEELVAGTELRRLEVATATTAGERIDSAVEVRAVDREGRSHALDAALRLAGDTTRAVLERLSLDLPGGAWRLAEPATIEHRDGEVTVDRFLARSEAGRISLAGRASARGEQNLVLGIDGVDLASFASLAPKGLEPAGTVSLEARLDGTAEAPVLDASLAARALRASAVRAEALDARLGYRDGEAVLRVDLRQDARHGLEARGRVPIDVGWGKAAPLTAADLPLDVQVRSGGLDLSFLEAFGERKLENVAGTLVLDVSVGGTAARPEPRGTVSLRDGAVDLTALGVRIRDLGGDVSLARDAVTLERLEASAGEGRLEASGRLGLRGLAPGRVDATLRLEKWPAIRTARYDAKVAGELSARGPFDALDATGRLEVLSATIRPDLAFLANRPPERDGTIVLVGAGAPPPEPRADATKKPAVGETVNRYDGLSLDVTVEVERNVWIKQQGTAIELAGEVDARKARGGDLQVVGRIDTRRGWVRFQGKRFRLVEGEIRFTGGKEIDPSLDVVARHRVREYEVDVVVRGTAGEPELELRSSPPLEQADVLSVLLFGKPTSELTSGEESTLGDEAAALATSFAVSEVSQKVTEALGIEDLGIQIEEVSADRAAVGAYVTERTYVSVSQDLSGDEGREVALEYEILPPSWSVVTSTNTAGESGGDVIWKKRY